MQLVGLQDVSETVGLYSGSENSLVHRIRGTLIEDRAVGNIARDIDAGQGQ